MVVFHIHGGTPSFHPFKWDFGDDKEVSRVMGVPKMDGLEWKISHMVISSNYMWTID